MTRQVAIRLPDDLVEYVDGLVEQGAEQSRASFVTRAARREQRRLVAQRDVEILAGLSPAKRGELDSLARYALEHAPPLD